ncbi:MAG: DegT/DnrJ/EryC1/StrS family aminotransferase, partial [Candidatus Micrarchaeota archaeon]
PRKALTTGEGGAITTDDDKLAALCASLKDHGKNYCCDDGVWSATTSFVRPGFNYRMSDVLAAIGLAQLPRFDATVKRRQQLAARYSELFESEGIESELLRVPKPPATSFGNHAFQSYVVYLLKAPAGGRDKIIASLKQKGIETQIGTFAVHLQPAYARKAKTAEKRGVSLRNSELAFRNSLTLPLYSSMTDVEQELVVKELIAELKRF